MENPQVGAESVGMFEKTPEQRAQATSAAKAELLAALAQESQQEVQPEPVQAQAVAADVPAAEPVPTDNSQAGPPRDEQGRFAPKAEVPAKFQKPDGSLDEAKLDKGLSALEKLAKYKQLEKDFHKSRQTAQEPQFQAQAQQPPAYQYAPPPPQPFPSQAQAQQFNTPEMQQFIQMASVADYVAAQRSAMLEAQVKEMKRDQQLKILAETLPDFLDNRVADEIGKVMEERKSWIWNLENPHEEAYYIAKGRLGEKHSGSAKPQQSPAATLPGGSSNVNVAAAAVTSQAKALEDFGKLDREKQRALLMKLKRQA